MISPPKRKPRSARDLLSNRLEKVSKDVFKTHYPLITQLVGDSPGIYALYDGDELYYVGKSTEVHQMRSNSTLDGRIALQS